MSGDPCICGDTETWHPECYQKQQQEATAAREAAIFAKGKESGLREAAAWVAIEEKLPEADVPVLAYFINEHGKPRRIRAFYAPRFTVTTGVDNDWYEFKDGDDEAYLPEGWYESNEFEDTHWHVTDKVTHWMPLPEPPPASPFNIGEGELVCEWVGKTHKYRIWRETSCGNENYSMDEGFKFCPYCGKPLVCNSTE